MHFVFSIILLLLWSLCLWSWKTSLSRSPSLHPALLSAERGTTVALLRSLLTSVKMPPWGTGHKGSEGWGAPHKDPPPGITFSAVRSWRLRQRPQNGPSLLCVTLKGPALRDCGCPTLPPPQGSTRYHKERYCFHVIPRYHKRKTAFQAGSLRHHFKLQLQAHHETKHDYFHGLLNGRDT